MPAKPAKDSKKRVSYRQIPDDTLRLLPATAVQLRARKMSLKDDGDISLLNHLHTALGQVIGDPSTHGPEFIRRTDELRAKHLEVENLWNEAGISERKALRARADVLKDALTIASGVSERLAPHFEAPDVEEE